MPVTIVIGAQWGDEGKGGTVDSLAANVDIVARFSGGDNAGHTVNVGEKVFKLHLIPSGILHKKVTCVMGNGMVINPVHLLAEIDHLIEMGIEITPERLYISTRAHIITPAHLALDAANEKARGTQSIGTTLRGIGPAYLDKVGRRGIRAGEMLSLENFAEKLKAALDSANELLESQKTETINIQEHVQSYVDAADRIRPFLKDTTCFINQQLRKGAQVMCEGAQGALLDVDHGSYPYVTSSSPSSGGALTGLGFGPTYVERVIGVAKAFNTRVGSGPMPTEVDHAVANHLRGTGENFWDEFGTTTGRERRCGWLDAVILKYTTDVNGFTELVLTKLDILSGLDEIKIAVAYEIDGKQFNYPPATNLELARAKPIYETLPGWQEDIMSIRQFNNLPENARLYVKRIAELCDTHMSMLSVGPERDQTIIL